MRAKRVDGSRPSPSMSRLRPAARAVLLAVCGSLALAAGQARAGSMTFHVESLETGACGARCPHVIVAEGVIEEDTPQAFVDFLRQGGSDANLRRIVFFNSRGGNVVASMIFGHILRELKVAGVVGRLESGSPYAGECMSACVYALMGAVRRVAPAGSQVALHRMSIIEAESVAEDRIGGGARYDPPGASVRVTRSFADQSMVAVLKRYAQRMGVNPGLVRAAESLPPDTVHVLSPGEMRRWSFAASQL